jgi:hypothetical protein
MGAVEVDEGEIVKGSIVAIGRVTVKGVVRGDVISYKGITITSTGTIEGDARAPEILKMRGGVITGSRYENPLPSIPEIVIFEKTSSAALTVILIIFASLILLGLLIVAVVRKAVTRVQHCLETGMVKSFLIGLAFWFALGPLMALLVLTIIGIPVATLILPMALILAIILGIIGFSLYLGGRLKTSIEWSKDSAVKQTLIGLSVLMVPWILMSALMVPSSGLSDLFLVIAIILWSIVICAGIGAVILTRFGTRGCVKKTDESIKVSAEFGKVKPPSPPPLGPEFTRRESPGQTPSPTPPPLKDDEKDESE